MIEALPELAILILQALDGSGEVFILDSQPMLDLGDFAFAKLRVQRAQATILGRAQRPHCPTQRIAATPVGQFKRRVQPGTRGLLADQRRTACAIAQGLPGKALAQLRGLVDLYPQ
ncbi:hypothetical protein D3C85_1538040 [compost metagenome]